MTSYTGKCRVGIKGRDLLTGIQVTDGGGNSIPLPLSDYLARGVQPDYASLPWCEDVIGTHRERTQARDLHPLPETPEAIKNGCPCKILSDSGRPVLPRYSFDKSCPIHG